MWGQMSFPIRFLDFLYSLYLKNIILLQYSVCVWRGGGGGEHGEDVYSWVVDGASGDVLL